MINQAGHDGSAQSFNTRCYHGGDYVDEQFKEIVEIRAVGFDLFTHRFQLLNHAGREFTRVIRRVSGVSGVFAGPLRACSAVAAVECGSVAWVTR